MTFEHAEHAKWALNRAPLMFEYLNGTKNILATSAARGFILPPANMLNGIVETGKIAKLKLVGANGELYREQVGIMLEQKDFDLKLAIEYERLELALYIQELVNALAWEKAQMENAFKKDKAYMRKLDADVNKRNYAILIGRADIESQLVDYKIREVEAERLGLGKELELIAEEVKTANERLKMIEWLNRLIVKERAILELEKQRAIILQAVIAIKAELAAIQEGMIPLYETQADAQIQKAAAITAEIKWKAAIINLGFDRIDLKEAQVTADITENEKKELLEAYELDLVINRNSLTLAKSEYAVALTQYKVDIDRQILAIQEATKKASVGLPIDSRSERATIDYTNRTELKAQSASNISDEIVCTITKIIGIASTLKKSQRQSSNDNVTVSNRTSYINQRIS